MAVEPPSWNERYDARRAELSLRCSFARRAGVPFYPRDAPRGFGAIAAALTMGGILCPGMAATSVFDRLTQFTVRPWMDPREKRLTAAFAAVAEHIPTIAQDLASAWLGTPVTGDLTVETEKPIDAGFIDLEWVFTVDGERTAVVWIEAKHGSPLSGADQLAKYRRQLRLQPGRVHSLVLLVPADFDHEGVEALRPQDAKPDDGVPRLVSWQEVYAELVQARGATDDRLERWLLEQLVAFMENEGLNERAFDPALVSALEHMVHASDAAETVMRRADLVVARAWGERYARPKPAYLFDGNPSTYSPWPREASAGRRNWRGATLVWGLGSSVAQPAHPQFYAGLNCGSEGPLARPVNEPWIASLRQQGFELGPDGSDWWLTSYLPIGNLLSETRAPEQAHRLGEWVLGEFRKVSSRPPAG